MVYSVRIYCIGVSVQETLCDALQCVLYLIGFLKWVSSKRPITNVRTFAFKH